MLDFLFRRPFRIAVMVSGRGSNLGAIIKAVQDKRLKNVKISLVLSDNQSAYALTMAKKAGIKAQYIPVKNFKTKLEGEPESQFIEAIRKSRADLVVMAGFMRVVKPAFIKAFENRIINIHPSLLPLYPGLHTHQRAMEAGEKYSGCTVHFVNNVVDGGRRIMQARVPILPTDTPESLASRVLEKEHVILPRVIGMIAAGELTYENCPAEPVIL